MTDSTQEPSDLKRENCWFLSCTNIPDGRVYNDEGEYVECCESHGTLAAAHGWEQYVPKDSPDGDGE